MRDSMWPMLRLSAPLLFCLSLLLACGSDAPKFRATDVSGTSYGRGFELTDHNGQPRSRPAGQPFAAGWEN